IFTKYELFSTGVLSNGGFFARIKAIEFASNFASSRYGFASAISEKDKMLSSASRCDNVVSLNKGISITALPTGKGAANNAGTRGAAAVRSGLRFLIRAAIAATSTLGCTF